MYMKFSLVNASNYILVFLVEINKQEPKLLFNLKFAYDEISLLLTYGKTLICYTLFLYWRQSNPTYAFLSDRLNLIFFLNYKFLADDSARSSEFCT